MALVLAQSPDLNERFGHNPRLTAEDVKTRLEYDTMLVERTGCPNPPGKSRLKQRTTWTSSL